MFPSKNGWVDKIPPTKAALKQHVKRGIYQGSIIWGQTTEKDPKLPSPQDWGWKLHQGTWCPHWSDWTDLQEASTACREFLSCGCQKKCRVTTCTCLKAGLMCTGNCKVCKGQCLP